MVYYKCYVTGCTCSGPMVNPYCCMAGEQNGLCCDTGDRSRTSKRIVRYELHFILYLPIKVYTLQCFVLLAQCDCQYIWEDLKPSGCIVYTAPPYGYKCIRTYALAWRCRADGILKCSEKEISVGMCRGDTEIGSCTNDCFGYSK